MHIGKAIKYIREKLGYSQYHLAKQIGCSPYEIEVLEGLKDVSKHTQKKIMDFFQIDRDILILTAIEEIDFEMMCGVSWQIKLVNRNIIVNTIIQGRKKELNIVG